MVKERSIPLAIIFSILTLGIYSIYWIVVMTDDAARLSGTAELSGGKTILFSLLTCGIYTFYWNFKIGKMMATAQEKAGVKSEDRSTLYLVLSIIGLCIISMCLIQSDLNALAR